MSVALENARLFDETQRLLEESRQQRNRELAVISRVGQALVGQLDPQGIYDLVGEELRQIFDAQVGRSSPTTARPGCSTGATA